LIETQITSWASTSLRSVIVLIWFARPKGKQNEIVEQDYGVIYISWLVMVVLVARF
jgi:hypothetical protein